MTTPGSFLRWCGQRAGNAAISAALTLAGTATAVAAEPGAENPTGKAALADDEGFEQQFLVGTIAPHAGAASILASGFGGYDGAARSAVVGASTEVAVTGWLALRAGFEMVPPTVGDEAAAPARVRDGLRANLGVRAQFLRQEAAGIDGAVAVSYRQERFTEDGGLVEGVLAVGRHSRAWQTFANLSYAQDPEGDDFEGELRAAALCRITRPFNLGLQASYRRDLGSTDGRRSARSNPDVQVVGGPVATYGLRNVVLLLQGGLSHSQRLDESRNGAFVVGGVGAAF